MTVRHQCLIFIMCYCIIISIHVSIHPSIQYKQTGAHIPLTPDRNGGLQRTTSPPSETARPLQPCHGAGHGAGLQRADDHRAQQAGGGPLRPLPPPGCLLAGLRRLPWHGPQPFASFQPAPARVPQPPPSPSPLFRSGTAPAPWSRWPEWRCEVADWFPKK